MAATMCRSPTSGVGGPWKTGKNMYLEERKVLCFFLVLDVLVAVFDSRKMAVLRHTVPNQRKRHVRMQTRGFPPKHKSGHFSGAINYRSDHYKSNKWQHVLNWSGVGWRKSKQGGGGTWPHIPVCRGRLPRQVFPSWSKLPLSWLPTTTNHARANHKDPGFRRCRQVGLLLPVLRSSNLLWWTSWCLSCKHIPLYISNARCDQTTVVKYVLREMKRWRKRAWLVFARANFWTEEIEILDEARRRNKDTRKQVTVKTQLVNLTSNDSYKTNSVTKVPSNDLSW